jgi:hypothetical protein
MTTTRGSAPELKIEDDNYKVLPCNEHPERHSLFFGKPRSDKYLRRIRRLGARLEVKTSAQPRQKKP